MLPMRRDPAARDPMKMAATIPALTGRCVMGSSVNFPCRVFMKTDFTHTRRSLWVEGRKLFLFQKRYQQLLHLLSHPIPTTAGGNSVASLSDSGGGARLRLAQGTSQVLSFPLTHSLPNLLTPSRPPRPGPARSDTCCQSTRPVSSPGLPSSLYRPRGLRPRRSLCPACSSPCAVIPARFPIPSSARRFL